MDRGSGALLRQFRQALSFLLLLLLEFEATALDLSRLLTEFANGCGHKLMCRTERFEEFEGFGMIALCEHRPCLFDRVMGALIQFGTSPRFFFKSMPLRDSRHDPFLQRGGFGIAAVQGQCAVNRYDRGIERALFQLLSSLIERACDLGVARPGVGNTALDLVDGLPDVPELGRRRIDRDTFGAADQHASRGDGPAIDFDLGFLQPVLDLVGIEQ